MKRHHCQPLFISLALSLSFPPPHHHHLLLLSLFFVLRSRPIWFSFCCCCFRQRIPLIHIHRHTMMKSFQQMLSPNKSCCFRSSNNTVCMWMCVLAFFSLSLALDFSYLMYDALRCSWHLTKEILFFSLEIDRREAKKKVENWDSRRMIARYDRINSNWLTYVLIKVTWRRKKTERKSFECTDVEIEEFVCRTAGFGEGIFFLSLSLFVDELIGIISESKNKTTEALIKWLDFLYVMILLRADEEDRERERARERAWSLLLLHFLEFFS